MSRAAAPHVLAIDTALNACSVALAPLDAAGTAVTRHEPLTRGHAEMLFPMIASAAEDADIPMRAVTRIVVTTGPGHFTGARVGLAAARSMALALGCPCIGVSTLEALMGALPGDGIAVSAIDARRGDVYLLIRGHEPVLLSLDAACERIRSAQTDPSAVLRLIGSGAPLIAEQVGGPEDGVHVDPRVLIDPLWLLAYAGADPQAYPPCPLYLRAPDATPPAAPSWTARP
ncbi:MAG: tRNA (adenosine(37)-N6)-threonylcarbamoyltransferase complex dimerization subunit type 1 TsaB [Alphaproteobacteria bacterium]